MLNEGYVHFVASDAHDLVNRPPRLDAARDLLAGQFDEEYADLLVEVHPRAVIEGRPLQLSPLPHRAKKRRWFSFGGSSSA
jgi:protein-tyrosine phosphatase